MAKVRLSWAVVLALALVGCSGTSPVAPPQRGAAMPSTGGPDTTAGPGSTGPARSGSVPAASRGASASGAVQELGRRTIGGTDAVVIVRAKTSDGSKPPFLKDHSGLESVPGPGDVAISFSGFGEEPQRGTIIARDVQPGRYKLQITAPGWASVDTRVTAEAGKELTLSVELVPVAPPAPPSAVPLDGGIRVLQPAERSGDGIRADLGPSDAALASGRDQIRDLLLGHDDARVDPAREVLVAFSTAGSGSCPPTLAGVAISREQRTISPEWSDPYAGGTCTADYVEYQALVAIDRSVLPDAPFALGEPGHARLTFVAAVNDAPPKPRATIPKDLQAALADAWIDPESGVAGTYGTPALAGDRLPLDWSLARATRVYSVTREDPDAPDDRHRLTATDPVTGKVTNVVTWQGGVDSWTLDAHATRLFVVVQQRAAVEVIPLGGGAHERIELPEQPAYGVIASRSGRALLVPLGADAVTGAVVVDTVAREAHKLGAAPGVWESIALGEHHAVTRETVDGPFRLIDIASGAATTIGADLIAYGRYAHALDDDRFVLSGYGRDGRYRYVIVDGADGSARVLLELAAPLALRQQEVLLTPEWLLIGRWSVGTAVAAGGDLYDALDLRDGTLVADAALVSACPAAEIPCPR